MGDARVAKSVDEIEELAEMLEALALDDGFRALRWVLGHDDMFKDCIAQDLHDEMGDDDDRRESIIDGGTCRRCAKVVELCCCPGGSK